MVGGRNHNKIKPHTLWVGNAHAGQQSHHRRSPPGVSPKRRAGVPSWRSDNGRRGLQRTRLWWQAGLTAGIPRKRGRQRLYSWRARTRTCAKQGLVSLVLQGLLWGWAGPVSEAHRGDRGTGSTNSGRCLPAWLPLKAAISPSIPRGPELGHLRPSNTGRGHGPIRQQTGFRSAWAQSSP